VLYAAVRSRSPRIQIVPFGPVDSVQPVAVVRAGSCQLAVSLNEARFPGAGAFQLRVRHRAVADADDHPPSFESASRALEVSFAILGIWSPRMDAFGLPVGICSIVARLAGLRPNSGRLGSTG
jgi:hypothetical protein